MFRAIARLVAFYGPVPAGFLAGSLLLFVVWMSQSDAPSHRAPEPPSAAKQMQPAEPRPPAVVQAPAPVEERASQQIIVRPKAPSGDLGVLLPPRSDAIDLTRRLERPQEVLPAQTLELHGPPEPEPLVAVPNPPGASRPRIAIVIDDMGYDGAQSARAVELPAPVTLAYLPTAPDVPAQVRAARLLGHEIMLHLPMEPNDRAEQGRQEVLSVTEDIAALKAQLDRMLGRFGGYIGVNNHMGSRFTSDRARMAVVLAELKRRGLFFLDSRTSGRSVGAEAAADIGLPFAVRDIFLDHDSDPEKIRARMAETEEIARLTGEAIAIGHPRPNTMDLIGPWLREVTARGFELVPVSVLLKKPELKRLARNQAAE